MSEAVRTLTSPPQRKIICTSIVKASELINAQARTTKRFGIAWLVLAVALAVHVADEALTDFLSVWNPTVLAIRERIPWSPLPTFTFAVWIAGLMVLIVVLLLSSPLAFRGARWFAFVGLAFSTLMIGNGLLHVGASVAQRHLMPGFWSSPLLAIASAAVLICASSVLRSRSDSRQSKVNAS